ncbi:MAG TPA: hypothetical protein PKK94_20410, partial [Leptospiraceae bacterium]|nr:hypothetical protein [Leptospiraceae bacterium]
KDASDLISKGLDLLKKGKSYNNILEKIVSDESAKKPIDTDCSTLASDPDLEKKFGTRRQAIGEAMTRCYKNSLELKSPNDQYLRLAQTYGNQSIIEYLDTVRTAYNNKESFLPDPPLPKANIKITPLPGHPSQKYKMGVLTFMDQTLSRRAELARYALADILTSELFLTNRFSMLDRRDIVQIEKMKEAILVNSKAKKEEEQAKPAKDESASAPPAKSLEKKEGIESSSDPTVKTPGSIRSAENIYFIDKPNEYKRKTEEDKNWFNYRNVDGLLHGYITSVDFQKGEMFVDYRIVYPSSKDEKDKRDRDTAELNIGQEFGDLIVFAGSQKIHFNYDEKQELITFNRDDLRAIASDIFTGFADTKTVNELLTNASDEGLSLRNPVVRENQKDIDLTAGKKTLKILKVEGDTVIINAGAVHGIRHGYVGYIAEQENYETYSYLAQFVVENVFDKSSKCTITEGRGKLKRDMNEGLKEFDVVLK